MLESIASGVIANYIFATLGRLRAHWLAKMLPAAFHANPAILSRLDRQVQFAASQVLKQHGEYQTIRTFFNERNLANSLVLKPVFDHLIQNKPLDRDALKRDLISCLETGEEIKDGRIVRQYRSKTSFSEVSFKRENKKENSSELSIDTVIDCIVREMRSALREDAQGHRHVIEAAIDEVRRTIHTIEYNLTAGAQEPRVSLEERAPISRLLKSYVKQRQRMAARLMIHGLSGVARDEYAVRHLLENAFVPLTVQPLLHLPEAMEGNTARTWRGGAVDILQTAQLLILRGNAGSGKTTLMQWYILHCLVDHDAVGSSVRMPLTPVFVPLRTLEVSGDFDWTPGGLAPALLGPSAFPFDWIEQANEAGHCLAFLLDGVDELGEAKRERFWGLVRGLRDVAPAARIVITSRHLSAVHLGTGVYRDFDDMTRAEVRQARLQWQPPEGFLEFLVSPLNDNEIADFIEKWHRGIDPNVLNPIELEKVGGYPSNLLYELDIEQNNSTHDLCRTPLLCGLVCLVHFIQEGRLPKSQRQLYEISTHILARTRDESRDLVQSDDFQRLGLAARIGLLGHIALTMQEGAADLQSNQGIEVNKDLVKKWVRKWLDSNSFKELDETVVLEKMLERTNLLREPGVGRIDFVHRSFMEYLAAGELVASREPYAIRTYIERDQWWSTLEFAMDTETGGIYFAGELVEQLIDFTIGERDSSRILMMRIVQLIGKMSRVPHRSMAAIARMVEVVFPPQNNDEVDEMLCVPFEALEPSVNKFQTRWMFNQIRRRLCAMLLARHPDDRFSQILKSSVGHDTDPEIIFEINKSLKLNLSEQAGLLAGVRNDSYRKTVHVRFAELDFANFVPRRVKVICGMKSEGLSGLSVLNRAVNVTIGRADVAAIREMDKLSTRDGFRKVVVLEVVDVENLDFASLVSVFGRVRTLRMERCEQRDFSLLSRFECLEELQIVRHRSRVALRKEDIPGSLRKIRTFGVFQEMALEGLPKRVSVIKR